MTESTQRPTTDPIEATQDAVDAMADATAGIFERFARDLREAGQLGKKQWEDLLELTRANLSRDELHKRAQSFWTPFDTQFTRAQTTGLDALIHTVSFLRERTASFEAQLRQFKESVEPTAHNDVDTASTQPTETQAVEVQAAEPVAV